MGHEQGMYSGPCGSGTGISELPVEMLAGVLQHVPQRDRLTCCAVVNRKWRHATIMATSSVQYAADIEQGFNNLSAWLCSNAHLMQSIQVEQKKRDGIYIEEPIR